jgi:hypothetical protein
LDDPNPRIDDNLHRHVSAIDIPGSSVQQQGPHMPFMDNNNSLSHHQHQQVNNNTLDVSCNNRLSSSTGDELVPQMPSSIRRKSSSFLLTSSSGLHLNRFVPWLQNDSVFISGEIDKEQHKTFCKCRRQHPYWVVCFSAFASTEIKVYSRVLYTFLVVVVIKSHLWFSCNSGSILDEGSQENHLSYSSYSSENSRAKDTHTNCNTTVRLKGQQQSN